VTLDVLQLRRVARKPVSFTPPAAAVVWSGHTLGREPKVVARTLRQAWRADVGAAVTAAQLAMQMRLLDAHLRWDNLKQPAPEKEPKLRGN
jgi:hypothetical protein